MKPQNWLRAGLLSALLSLLTLPVFAQSVPISASDFDGSGRVDFGDFIVFAQAFGRTSADPGFDVRYDLDGDGAVGFGDFVIFARAFGKSPSDTVDSFLYIADTAAGEVRAFNTATNLQVPSRRIAASTPQGMAIAQVTGNVFVSALDTFHAFNSQGESLFKIPLTDEASLGFTTSRGGSKVTLADGDRLAFVSETAANVIEVIDLQAGASIGLIPVVPNPSGIVANRDGDRVYAAHGSEFASPLDPPISAIDVATRSVIDTFSVDGATTNRLALSPDGTRLYLNDVLSSVIRVIDTSTGSRVGTIDIGTSEDVTGQMLDIAVGSGGQKLYATLTRTILGFDLSGNPVPIVYGDLVVVDLVTETVANRVTVGQIAANLGVSPDEAVAYVSGVEDPNNPTVTIVIVDLETGTKAGTLIGFTLPSDMDFKSGKPSLEKLVQAALAVR